MKGSAQSIFFFQHNRKESFQNSETAIMKNSKLNII